MIRAVRGCVLRFTPRSSCSVLCFSAITLPKPGEDAAVGVEWGGVGVLGDRVEIWKKGSM